MICRLLIVASALLTVSCKLILPTDSPSRLANALAGELSCPSATPAEWTSYAYDGTHSRCYSGPSRINPSTVSSLAEVWRISNLRAMSSTPVVDKGVVYFGDWWGRLHMVSLETGKPVRPALTLNTERITGTPLLTESHIYVAGMNNLYSINRSSYAVEWETLLDSGPNIQIDSSPVLAAREGIIIIGVSSMEVFKVKGDFGFAGSVVGIEAASGRVLWRLHTTTNDAAGGGGVSVWSSAAVDESRGLAWIGTGQTYEKPASPLSDSLLCIDYRTGSLKWSHQYSKNDVWNFMNIVTDGVDLDVGSSPHLFSAGGRDLVAVGSKAGIYKAFDRDSGNVVWETTIGGAGAFGGVLVSGAMANGVLYTASNAREGTQEDPSAHTETHALDMATGKTLWKKNIPETSFGTLALVNGILFQSTWHGEQGDIYGLDARTGQQLYHRKLDGKPGGGFSISGDTVLIGWGWTYVGTPADAAGGILALRPVTHNLPPAFHSDPADGGIHLAGTPYKGNLAPHVKDENGDPLSFTKINGPDWLTISPDGGLSGTPAKGVEGKQIWTVQVSDGELSTEGRLQIELTGSVSAVLPPLSDAAANVLTRKCVSCHAGEPLDLSSWPFSFKGGGAASMDELLMILEANVFLSKKGGSPRMPPEGPLTPAELAAFEQLRDTVRHWIGTRTPGYVIAEGGQFEWMVQRRAPPPAEAYPEGPGRTLKSYYERRAFAGAPPVIPHEVPAGTPPEETASCLRCHEEKGPDTYGSPAPASPHPERSRCLICHRDGKAVRLDPGRWVASPPPSRGLQKTEWEPPLIPHSLQGRELCIKCHAGEGAVTELRSPHPHREHCRQCHLVSAGGITGEEEN